MLKLIKHEFRKIRTLLVVLVAVAAGLFLLAPLGKITGRQEWMAISAVLLMFYGMAAYVIVLARGVSAYSAELRSKSGYLLMMVPRSTLSILFSKLLFSLALALLLLALCGAALMGAGMIALGEIYQVKGMINIARYALLDMGISLDAVVQIALLFCAELLSSVVMVVSMGYLAVTCSATVLQNGKLQGLISTLLFFVLAWVSFALQEALMPAMHLLYADSVPGFWNMAPSMLVALGLSCLYTALSALLLKRKVSL